MVTKPYGDKDRFDDFLGAFRARGGVVLTALDSNPSSWPAPDSGFFDSTDKTVLRFWRDGVFMKPYAWDFATEAWIPVAGDTLTGSDSIDISGGVVKFTGRYGTGNSNPGARAVAMGQSNTAGGVNSAALGEGNVLGAAAKNSIAAGYNNAATNETSALFGSGNTSQSSNAFLAGSGNKVTNGNAANCALLGLNNTVSGASNAAHCFLAGNGNTAAAGYCVAIGNGNSVSNVYNVAIGSGNTTSGTHSKTFGYGLQTKSFGTVAVGTYNIIPPTPYSTSSHDPRDFAFVIGIGGGASRENGFSMWKNGNVQLGRVATTLGGVPADNGNTLNVMGRISADLPVYANDAAADADAGLPSRSFYKLSGSRAVYQKP